RSEGDDALAVAVVEAVHDVLHALPLLPVTIVLEQAELPRAEGCEVGEHDAAPHDHELRRERPLGPYPEEVERGQARLVVMHALQRRLSAPAVLKAVDPQAELSRGEPVTA